MEVVYAHRAVLAIEKVAQWVEEKNTEGSGERWFDKLDLVIHSLAESKAKLAECKHPSLARYKYRCYTYKNWVIAFRITDKRLEVRRFIWGAQLA